MQGLPRHQKMGRNGVMLERVPAVYAVIIILTPYCTGMVAVAEHDLSSNNKKVGHF